MEPTRPGTRSTRFVNGSVFTGDHTKPWVDAVVIDGSRVGLAGGRAEVNDYAPHATEVDLEGRTLLPGLIDAHNHFLATGESLAHISLQQLGRTTKSKLLARVRQAATELPSGEAIALAGLDPAKLTDGPPTRWELDVAAPHHRVVAYHISGHGVLVNSPVFAASGLSDFAADPAGGSFSRDANGRLSGFCFDAAMQLVVPTAVDIGSHGPNFHVQSSPEELEQAVLRAQRAFVAAGLTTVCDAQVTAREMSTYQTVEAAGSLQLRTVCMPLSHQLSAFDDIGVTGTLGNDRLRIGPMKFYADGTLIGHTALCSHPYGPNGDNGYLLRPAEALSADLVRAYEAGWRVGVHVQGDQAIDVVLDALGQAATQTARPDLRPRLEHAGLPTAEQIRRIANLGAVTVNQPSYLYEMGDQFLADFGDVAHRLQPLRDELDVGVRVVISSDSDVASYRPLNTLAAAMQRRTMTGKPIGAHHALTLDEALFAHTIEAAYAVGWEHFIGSLDRGKAADLTILDGDARAVDGAELRNLEVWGTIIDGVTVHGPEDGLVG